MKKLLLLILLTIHISAFTSVVDSLNTALKEPNADKGDIYIKLSAEYLKI